MKKPTIVQPTVHELEGTVLADPTKKFFVTMLTRDIALIDAIMDLIDNCIDGVHRQRKKLKLKGEDFIYKGYCADITLNENEFSIKDNCGGIPLSVAMKYAFRMGRSEEYQEDDNLETLGMYGIGMKRAIFKIGLRSEVTTWHDDTIYKVTIPENWATIQDWLFNYKILRKTDVKGLFKDKGTLVQISKLHKTISRQFKDKSGFVKDLQIALNNHYGYIIQQGFTIKLNGVKIDPIELNIITTDPGAKSKKSIKPYVYTAKIEDVDIEIIIGFYRPPASEEEILEELDGSYAASLSENAGITVLCNDRVVLYCDKTFLTGWGDPPVPKYHTQFISIAGVVHFRTNTPINLPVTTTKRGLDTSSPVYAAAKNKIKDGLRYFTTFTNNWKTQTDERAKLFASPKKINALSPGQSTKSSFIKLTKGKIGENSKVQIPDLPRPATIQNSRLLAISFSRERESIDKIKNYFLQGKPKSASEVGGWCFDKILSQVE